MVAARERQIISVWWGQLYWQMLVDRLRYQHTSNQSNGTTSATYGIDSSFNLQQTKYWHYPADKEANRKCCVTMSLLHQPGNATKIPPSRIRVLPITHKLHPRCLADETKTWSHNCGSLLLIQLLNRWTVIIFFDVHEKMNSPRHWIQHILTNPPKFRPNVRQFGVVFSSNVIIKCERWNDSKCQ